MAGHAAASRSDGLLIRPAHPDDAYAIADQHLKTREWAYRGSVPDEHMQRQREAISRRAGLYANRIREQESGRSTWVADLKGRIVGFAMTGPSRDEDAGEYVGELEAIYVHPDFIGQGIGRLLWEQALEDLRRQGDHEVMLWVFEDNPLGRRFYEAAGFQLDGGAKLQDWGGKLLSTVRMRRNL